MNDFNVADRRSDQTAALQHLLQSHIHYRCRFCDASVVFLSVCLSVCLSLASRSQRVSLIVIPFCLSVWMSVGHSTTYSLLPYFRCQREKICKISPISNGSPLTRILATANVTHRAIWLACLSVSVCLSVCLSVGLSVGHDCVSCKTANSIEMPFGVVNGWTKATVY